MTAVPVTNPQKPNRPIAACITSFQRQHPKAPSVCQNVTTWMIGGKIRAMAELEKAPTNEIISSR